MTTLPRKNGFTLIELIIVIVIIGIISLVALPKYVDMRSSARDAALRGALGSIRSAIQIQYSNAAATTGTASYPEITGSIFADNVVPAEPFFDSSVVTTTNENPISTFSDDGGYIYNQTTGEIRADVSGKHSF